MQFCRQKYLDMNEKQYSKAVEGKWKVGEEMLPRPKDAAEADGRIRVLVHTPTSEEIGLPLVLWAHSGGTNIGGCAESFGADLFNQISAKAPDLKFCWASVEYRLAPEAKFPKAVDDMTHAYEALQDPALAKKYGYDPQKIGIAGASAGGFLAGHAALQLARAAATSHASVPTFLAMVCPMADPTMRGESHAFFGDLPMCPTSWIRWSWRALLSENDEEPSEARLREGSLLQADWSPARGLRALNVVATFDCLTDEGLALTKAMASRGTETEEVIAEGSHCVAPSVDADAKERHLSWWCRVLSPA